MNTSSSTLRPNYLSGDVETLQNVHIHTRCHCYDAKPKAAELCELDRNTTHTVSLFAQEIVFLIEGHVRLTLENADMVRDLNVDEFVLLPVGENVLYEALEDSTLLIFRMTDEVPECHVFNIAKMSDKCTEDRYNGIYALTVDKRMRSFLHNFLDTFTDGLKCSQYVQMQISSMLFLIHAYYPLEECIKFFSLILSPDVGFSEFVRLNHMKYRTVTKLASAMDMTTQQFANQFRRVFGMTPINWLRREQAKHVYRDICRSNLSLKEIALKYDFSAQANFTRFCHTFFGASPGDIRLSLKDSFSECI